MYPPNGSIYQAALTLQRDFAITGHLLLLRPPTELDRERRRELRELKDVLEAELVRDVRAVVRRVDVLV